MGRKVPRNQTVRKRCWRQYDYLVALRVWRLIEQWLTSRCRPSRWARILSDQMRPWAKQKFHWEQLREFLLGTQHVVDVSTGWDSLTCWNRLVQSVGMPSGRFSSVVLSRNPSTGNSLTLLLTSTTLFSSWIVSLLCDSLSILLQVWCHPPDLLWIGLWHPKCTNTKLTLPVPSALSHSLFPPPIVLQRDPIR